MNSKCKILCEKLTSCLQKWSWFPVLLGRISIGYVFLESGWGKIQHIPKIVEYFTELGIPFASIQAPFVAGVELIGGGLLLLGWMTRIASFPLIGTMIVAILTAKREDITSLSDLLGMSEFLMIVVMVFLIFDGAGRLSVDHLCCKKSEA